jgi:predicted outer membrane repeat protein
MYNYDSSHPYVSSCVFSSNSAVDAGGAIYIKHAQVLLDGCAFLSNTASNGCGGAVHNDGGGLDARQCTFTGNETQAANGGAVSSIGTSSVKLYNCMIKDNIAWYYGGGVYLKSSNSTIVNCTSNGNHASDGGGLYGSGYSSLFLGNSILWADVPNEISAPGDWDPNVEYCDVQGGDTGVGNIDVDPMFVDAQAGDLRLSPGSPCIDAGNSWQIPDWMEFDLDGNPRLHDDPGTDDTGDGYPCVDMGAYEYQGESPSCPADINGDDIVNVDDLFDLLNAWGNLGGPADINSDGIVNVDDLFSLLNAWGPCP